MLRVLAKSRRALAKVPKRLWLGTGGAVVLLLGVWVVLPLSAFAGDSVKLVSASSTTTGNTQSVTMKCPGGTTAVGVTADVKGTPGISINKLMPQGRQAVASASRTGAGAGPWTLKAQALCVRKTADITYVSGTWSAAPGAVTHDTWVLCPAAKELIGFGWSVDPAARVANAVAFYNNWSGDPGGTGYPPGSGDGTGYPPGTGNDTGYPPGTGNDTGYPPGTGNDTGYPPGTGNDTGYPPGTGNDTGYPPGTGNDTGYPPGTGNDTGYPPGTGNDTGYPPGTGNDTGYPPSSGDGTGYPPGTGNDTGYIPGSGEGTSGGGHGLGRYAAGASMATYAVSNTPQGWSQSLVGVCATSGHDTEGVAGNHAATGATQSTSSVACPVTKQVHALGFYLDRTAGPGQAIRRLTVSSDATIGTLGVINLNAANQSGSPPTATVTALCVAS